MTIRLYVAEGSEALVTAQATEGPVKSMACQLGDGFGPTRLRWRRRCQLALSRFCSREGGWCVRRIVGDKCSMASAGLCAVVLPSGVLACKEECRGILGSLGLALERGRATGAISLNPRSQERWAQAIAGAVATGSMTGAWRLADHASTVILLHGDGLPWPYAGQAAGLVFSDATPLELADGGVGRVSHPSALFRLAAASRYGPQRRRRGGA